MGPGKIHYKMPSQLGDAIFQTVFYLPPRESLFFSTK